MGVDDDQVTFDSGIEEDRRGFTRAELAAIAARVKEKHNAAFGTSRLHASTLGMCLMESLGTLPIADPKRRGE